MAKRTVLSGASASASRVAIAHESVVAEAPTAEIRRALEVALRNTYGGKETYVWLHDYDATKGLAYFEVSAGGKCTTYQEAYTIAAQTGAVTLSGKREEAVSRTTYAAAPGARVVEAGHFITPNALAVEAKAVAATRKPGRFVVRYIRAGWSKNGRYYPAELLKTEGVAAAVPGTLLFIDHQTDAEYQARPAGTVEKLAAVQEGPAWWDDKEQAVTAVVRTFVPWRERLDEMQSTIGLSVRAWITAEDGEAESRRGTIVTSIEGYKSVDFVTVPAAGGEIVSVLESLGGTAAVEEARNSGAWLESRIHMAFTAIADDMYGGGRLTRPERITLSAAIGAALDAFVGHVESNAPQLYKRDLWDEPEAPDQADEGAGNGELTREETTMTQPNTGAAPTSTTGTPTGPSNGGTVPATPAVTPEATADARVAVAEADRDRFAHQAALTAEAQRQQAMAIAERDRAVQEARELRANETARGTIATMLAEAALPAALAPHIGPRVSARVIGHVPLFTEGDNAGTVDSTALTAAITAAIEAERQYAAAILEAAGHGQVRGLGAGKPGDGLGAEEAEKRLNGVFSDIGLPKDVAAAAAKGRF